MKKVVKSFPRLPFEIFVLLNEFLCNTKYIFSEGGDFMRIIAIDLFLSKVSTRELFKYKVPGTTQTVNDIPG